ncbi:S-phase delaying protein 1 [Madurella mycetomatis]|uniref:S-phase delaying protein 1 n=1 Tax=Madurella mycetomatis TaxID=100816 RepID=A0A175W097_9PEZI|nr:S-phase delaying protein 1 [Madurella mycetomatis]
MTGPRTKRPFAGAASDPSQRQITSFFKSSSSTDSSATSTPSKPSALSGPVLPAQVQTDLLNVGMRVRKAIPEGYKTGNPYCAFQLWAEDDNNHHNNSSTKPIPSTTTFASTMRELEPFCGLNKVGGLAFQPPHTTTPFPENDGDDDDVDLMSMPSLASSQESAVSTASSITPSAATSRRLNVVLPTSATPNRKRFFVSAEEEEQESDGVPPHQHAGPFRLNSHGHGHDVWLDGEMSPRSLAPVGWENARVLAVPRTRQRKAPSMELEGQENVMVVVKEEDGNDFEEATFLDYRLASDMEVEVE